MSLKVLDHTGVGRTSDVIAAIEWVLQHGRLYGVRVINLSIGHPIVESYRSDPLNLAVQKAVSRGFVVVTSAGNGGRTDDGSVQYGGILSPANDPSVITVGAVDTNGTAFRSDDVVADFSSRGPTLFDGLVKPDLVAPGRRITSTAAPFSYLATTFPERLVAGATPEGGYQTLSGTSMAASIVSGTVALMLEARPSLQPAAVKTALQFSAEFRGDWYVLAAGAGSLNAVGAVEAAQLLPASAGIVHEPRLKLRGNLARFAGRENSIAGEVGSVVHRLDVERRTGTAPASPG